ncbi:PREDICTED: uncharacterized protein LOC106106942 [Papilio polytes]|uniref:uncharacterized protein LOC106106942 n=1 Tax=Papilio polytes TaxID=76194 RepID=UPI00067662F7|nr:PREDICTED: uncharacterized protein LOC106106942 [Papilio polytes]
MLVFKLFICLMVSVYAGPATESFKNQYCTDPRTMKRHTAYTEWADAYSCTRHRCQPGGRNLAIYTVGCKRVEPPESAIECEEVVEDTNMQFPYCCPRLRCLVVVRGEVWTRVLGQPWETLPAAEHEMSMDVENAKEQDTEKKESKSPNLQALVDAIGSRMRDIENVVQRMSQKVHRNKPQSDIGNSMNSIERRSEDIQTRKGLSQDIKEHDHEIVLSKNQYSNSESFKRFKSPSIYNRVKHMHGTTEPNSDVPLYVEDTNLNGYFSDVSNSILRRVGLPKEPIATYMAPVENRVKPQVHTIVVSSGEIEKSKKKKRTHKKKKVNKIHKKHHLKEEKKKHFNRKKSSEIEKNVVSLEDSSSVTS